MVRLRGKSCRKNTERSSSDGEPRANLPAGECGGKDQVSFISTIFIKESFDICRGFFFFENNGKLSIKRVKDYSFNNRIHNRI